MTKNIKLLACIILAIQISACTKGTKTDSAASDQAAVLDTSGLENPDIATNPKSGNVDESQAGFLDAQLPEDTLGAAPADPSKKDEKSSDVPQKDKLAETTPPPGTVEAPPSAAADSNQPLTLDNPNPSSENLSPTAEVPPMEAAAPLAPPTQVASLQKVKEVPFKVGKQLLNAVYIARPGDDYKKISAMIYGSDERVKDLKKANPAIKKVKAGQKIYYNSPNRVADESKIMNFYEEAGMPSSVYVSKDGDSLKSVSKELLGYPDAWKEVWSTNAVETKGKLLAGTELRYWKGAVAQTPPSAGTDGMMPPPLPPPSQAEAKMPDLPPPPPPVLPPKKMKQPPQQMVGSEEAMDQDTVMALAGAGIIAAGLALIIVIRKRRAQKSAGFESHTGV